MINESLKDKVPSHNEEAEEATLGALLLDSEALPSVIRYLRPEDFYKNAHKNIYRAVLDLFNKGEAIDLITVTDALKSSGGLESSGGTAYISGLTSVVPTSANIEYYAQIVQTCSIRRNLARIASQIISQSHEESLDIRQVIEEAEKQIFEIAERQHTGYYFKAREIVTKTIEAIEKLYHTKDSYTGIPTGFSSLDNYTSGFQNSEFIVIGARPSVEIGRASCRERV